MNPPQPPDDPNLGRGAEDGAPAPGGGNLRRSFWDHDTVVDEEDRSGVSVPEIPGFELLEQLGHGAMGVVFKARQLSTNRLVALKMIRGSFASHDDEVRFRNEAEAIAQLRHRHIVQVYDYAVADGHPYFSMELLDNGSLRDRMTGRWEPRKAAALIETLARALHHAHQHGIVHRDIKPDNILFSQDHEPQLTDFGLARREGCDYLQTLPGTLMGTPPYMSPEQVRGESMRVDGRADLWSLGTVLYELLTANRAFTGASTAEVLDAVLTSDPASPRARSPEVDKDLSTICMKCLAKDPPQRYDSALALAEDLLAYLELRPIRARPASGLTRVRKWIRRKPWSTVTVAASVLLVALAIGGYWHYDAHAAVHVSSYGHYTQRWGIPVGVHPLTRQQAFRRGWALEIERRGRRNPPRMVRVVGFDREPLDGLMTPWFKQFNFDTELAIDWSQMRYEYDHLGRLLEERASNASGVQVYVLHYIYPDDTTRRPPSVIAKYSARDGRALGEMMITFRHNEDGYYREVRFTDVQSGEQVKNGEGVYGYAILHNKDGLPAEIVNLGPGSQAGFLNTYGFAAASLEYDQFGNLLRLELRDEEGRFAETTLGWSVQVTEELADRRRILYYGGDDGTTPAVDTVMDGIRFHGIEFRRDKRGLLSELIYLDENETPIETPPASP